MTAHDEADPVGVLAALLTSVGTLIGGNPHVRIGAATPPWRGAAPHALRVRLSTAKRSGVGWPCEPAKTPTTVVIDDTDDGSSPA